MFLYRLRKVNSSEKLDKTEAAAREPDFWCCGQIYRSLIYGKNNEGSTFWAKFSHLSHLFPDLHISLQSLATTHAGCIGLVVGVGEEHKAHRPLLSNHKLLFCQKHGEAPTQLAPTKGKLTSSHNTCRAAGTNARASKQQITMPLVGKENFHQK